MQITLGLIWSECWGVFDPLGNLGRVKKCLCGSKSMFAGHAAHLEPGDLVRGGP